MAEETTEQISADDWGAAMAEQTTADAAAAPVQPHVFEQFGGAGGATAHKMVPFTFPMRWSVFWRAS